MSLFLLIGAVSLAFTPEHKEFVITAVIATVTVIAAPTRDNPARDNPAAECMAVYFLSWDAAKGAALCLFIYGGAKSCPQ